jgi:hypothetical protein
MLNPDCTVVFSLAGFNIRAVIIADQCELSGKLGKFATLPAA